MSERYKKAAREFRLSLPWLWSSNAAAETIEGALESLLRRVAEEAQTKLDEETSAQDEALRLLHAQIEQAESELSAAREQVRWLTERVEDCAKIADNVMLACISDDEREIATTIRNLILGTHVIPMRRAALAETAQEEKPSKLAVLLAEQFQREHK